MLLRLETLESGIMRGIELKLKLQWDDCLGSSHNWPPAKAKKAPPAGLVFFWSVAAPNKALGMTNRQPRTVKTACFPHHAAGTISV